LSEASSRTAQEWMLPRDIATAVLPVPISTLTGVRLSEVVPSPRFP
jgi:hypothetical protein